MDIAMAGFNLLGDQDKGKKQQPKSKVEKKEVPSASILVTTNGNKKFECIFCKSYEHESENCDYARK